MEESLREGKQIFIGNVNRLPSSHRPSAHNYLLVRLWFREGVWAKATKIMIQGKVVLVI
jgi:hypothetical protein